MEFLSSILNGMINLPLMLERARIPFSSFVNRANVWNMRWNSIQGYDYLHLLVSHKTDTPGLTMERKWLRVTEKINCLSRVL